MRWAVVRAFAAAMVVLGLFGHIFELRAFQLPDFQLRGFHPRAFREDAKKASEEKVYKIGGDVKAPQLIHSPQPDTEGISNKRLSGFVKIFLLVTKEGLPKDLKVISGIDKEVDQRALDAVKQWRFKPATKDNQPVTVEATIELKFHLL